MRTMFDTDVRKAVICRAPSGCFMPDRVAVEILKAQTNSGRLEGRMEPLQWPPQVHSLIGFGFLQTADISKMT